MEVTFTYTGDRVPVDYRDIVTNLIIADGITVIDKSDSEDKTKEDIGHIQDCTNLRYISGSTNTVKKFSYRAFMDCTSLESVNMPEVNIIGYEAFYKCESLESVNMPQLRTIEKQAFFECTSLVSLSVPQLETLGAEALSGCGSLKSVFMPKLRSVGDEAF